MTGEEAYDTLLKEARHQGMIDGFVRGGLVTIILVVAALMLALT